MYVSRYGYRTGSRSRRAEQAEDEGRVPWSRVPARVRRGLTVGQAVGLGLTDEWHHTSKYANETWYFDPVFVDRVLSMFEADVRAYRAVADKTYGDVFMFQRGLDTAKDAGHDARNRISTTVTMALTLSRLDDVDPPTTSHVHEAIRLLTAGQPHGAEPADVAAFRTAHATTGVDHDTWKGHRLGVSFRLGVASYWKDYTPPTGADAPTSTVSSVTPDLGLPPYTRTPGDDAATTITPPPTVPGSPGISIGYGPSLGV